MAPQKAVDRPAPSAPGGSFASANGVSAHRQGVKAGHAVKATVNQSTDSPRIKLILTPPDNPSPTTEESRHIPILRQQLQEISRYMGLVRIAAGKQQKTIDDADKVLEEFGGRWDLLEAEKREVEEKAKKYREERDKALAPNEALQAKIRALTDKAKENAALEDKNRTLADKVKLLQDDNRRLMEMVQKRWE